MRNISTKRLCYRYKYFFLAAFIVLCVQLSLFYDFTAMNIQIKPNTSSYTWPINKPQDRNKTNGPDPPETSKDRPLDNNLKDKFQLNCQINSKEVISAISRSKTNNCKQKIADLACSSLDGKFSKHLPNYCPLKGNHSSGFYYGCYKDSVENRDLNHRQEFPSSNSPNTCIKYCTNRGYLYAGLQFSKECWCGDRFGILGKEAEDKCNAPCTEDPKEKCGGYLTNRIFTTGLAAKVKNPIELYGTAIETDIKVKIVFVLTFSGRSVRQVRRLLKAIYHRDHFYFIHIDSRQEYMYNELIVLESLLPNVRLTRNRFATIWGGASLLQAHLTFITELLGIKDWKWDYYINLSESDYPIKKIDMLINFLTRYNGNNFLKSHGRDTPKFLKKQGLDQMFYECENHLWRLGPRELPGGIRFDGGSDWVGLHRKFCEYVITSDPLLDGLKELYKYSLLPVESFFHTVLQNSVFCDKWLDNNLHVTNWNRKKGCKCQNKHIVDWCGCSPNDFKSTDLDRLMIFEQKPRFFARKFEPVVNQDIINSLDLILYKDRPQDMKSFTHYWHNEYHHNDKPSNRTDVFLSFYGSFQRRSLEILKHSSCFLKPLRILESHAYFVEDHYNGVLLSFEAQNQNTGKIVVVESHLVQRGHLLITNSQGPIGRLLNLEVGTEFDLKENIFRNFGQFIGPYSSDISLKHSWGEGQPLTISVGWVDPTEVIAASYDLEIPEGNHIGSHKPELGHLLRPGVWKVKLMYKWEVLAETVFLVTPLTTFLSKPASLELVIGSHNGPASSYIGQDFTDFNKVFEVNQSLPIRQEALENGRKTGESLNKWVDNLTKNFWELHTSCISAQTSIGCSNIDICEKTSWSSKSEDPKSEIHGIDLQTGQLR